MLEFGEAQLTLHAMLLIKHLKCLFIFALASICLGRCALAQRMSVASAQISNPTNPVAVVSGDQSGTGDFSRVAEDPLDPGGEIEDPLAPVRQQVGTTRSAFGPDRSQTGKDDEWSIELAAEYGYVWNANLSNGRGA